MEKDRGASIFKYAILLVLGSIINGIGLITFTSNANVAPGGFTGLAIIGNYIWKLPIGTLIIILNIPIIILCYIFMGPKFGTKNFVNLLVNNLIIDLVVEPIVPVYTGDRLMGTLFGAVLSGIGLGLIYILGAPTGGSGAVSYLIRRKMPHLPIGNILMIMDCTIVLVSIFVYKDIDAAMYGIISLYVTVFIMNQMMTKVERNNMVTIISDKNPEIADSIMSKMNRGVTFLKGEGAYTGNQTKVIITAIKPQQYGQLKEIIEEHDKDAFYTVSDLQKTIGSNFRPV